MTLEQVIAWWKEQPNKKSLLQDVFLAKYIFNTNSIEGIDLSYRQTCEVFSSETIKNFSGDIRGLFSVTNSKNTFEFIMKSLELKTPITLSFIKKVHKVCMINSIDAHRYNDNEERAGEFKKHDYAVGPNDTGVAPEDVEEQLQEMIDFLNKNKDKDPIKLAVMFHCYFEAIHPFADGNGRVGRWLLNYFLMLNGNPPLVVFKETKNEYYDALQQFDEEEDFAPMYHYIIKSMEDTWGAERKKIKITSEFLD